MSLNSRKPLPKVIIDRARATGKETEMRMEGARGLDCRKSITEMGAGSWKTLIRDS